MKILHVFAGSLVLSTAATTAAAPLTPNSRVTAVTVYADRAVVTRTAAVELPGTGTVEVAFEKLPSTLVEQSLSVTGRGTAQVTILDVTARNTHLDFTPNDRVKVLEDELRGLAKQRRVLDDRGALLKSQEASLGRLETAATSAPAKDTAPRLTIEESGKLLLFLEEQRGKQATERQALDTQLEDLAAKQSAVERQLAQLRGAGGRVYKTVTVRVDAASVGTFDLALSYAVAGASWTPSYDVRANSSEATVTLSYFGVVRQNTGEDWKAVALTLSTAQPGLGGAAPEIGNWVVDIFVPRPARPASADAVTLSAFEVSNTGSGRSARGVVGASPPAMEKAVADASFAQATVESAATSASFKIASAASVPSDNTPQKVPVTSASLAATLEYATTPKRLATAFLTAKVANTSEFPLLPGTMNIFLDGTFVATSAMRTVMPSEKFDLALGADEGISVKHKRVQRFTEDTGLTNSGKRITYEYTTTIQNNKKIPARVTVSDHVPVSRNERIVVKVATPPEREQKPAKDGGLKWILDLKPGEKRELPLKFTIEHSNDVSVAGLEP